MELRRTDAGLFALTTAGDSLDGHELLERVDLAAVQTEVVSFADRPLDIAPAPDGWAEVRAGFDGGRRLRQSSNNDSAARAQELPLDHAVDRLVRRGDGWIAFALRDACTSDPSRCLPEQRAVLHQLAAGPLRAVSQTLLPRPDEPIPETGSSTREWTELLSQGDRLALIERRGITCHSEMDCNTLGIEIETRSTGVQGHQDQRWLHPFDAADGVFSPAVRLDDVPAFGLLSGAGFRVGSGHALFRFIPTRVERSTVLRARSELLLLPSLDAAGVEAQRRVTVRGLPMYVDDTRALTIEPAGPVDEDEPLPKVLVHRLSLRDTRAYIDQTLELPAGYVHHAWGEQQGYAIFAPQDRCAELASIFVVLGWRGTAIEEKGRIELPGTSWQLSQASDRLVIVSRKVDRFTQHALIEVDGDVAVRAIDNQPLPLPVAIQEAEARFGRPE